MKGKKRVSYVFYLFYHLILKFSTILTKKKNNKQIPHHLSSLKYILFIKVKYFKLCQAIIRFL